MAAIGLCVLLQGHDELDLAASQAANVSHRSPADDAHPVRCAEH
jgi:hypothetical protein